MLGVHHGVRSTELEGLGACHPGNFKKIHSTKPKFMPFFALHIVGPFSLEGGGSSNPLAMDLVQCGSTSVVLCNTHSCIAKISPCNVESLK